MFCVEWYQYNSLDYNIIITSINNSTANNIKGQSISTSAIYYSLHRKCSNNFFECLRNHIIILSIKITYILLNSVIFPILRLYALSSFQIRRFFYSSLIYTRFFLQQIQVCSYSSLDPRTFFLIRSFILNQFSYVD